MKSPLYIIPLSFLTGLFLTACGEEPRPDFDLSEALIIDTRERSQWAIHHVTGARHVDWDCIVLAMRVLEVNEDDPIVIYGSSATGASRAETSLRNMDFQLVRNAGSMQEAAELLERPVVRPDNMEPDEHEEAIVEACDERRQIRHNL
ncbi:MAG: rhodanese-like domain-containing protein [Natronospirillum sp.]|uniref:rhodanese-like domain-containing protein n=1 Tax=Natronospirillum sp. TaxID=2812955 RepID=UPI0025DC1147|nr:rhodanese-like domain-containing protein [Natronospirillum sp.]MCH8552774.1 rhodanese-like domain-containing protein [Natronospirillum sp.]